MNDLLCLPAPLFVSSETTGVERHTAQFMFERSVRVIGNCPYLQDLGGMEAVDGLCTDGPTANLAYRQLMLAAYPHLLGAWTCIPHVFHNVAKDIIGRGAIQQVTVKPNK